LIQKKQKIKAVKPELKKARFANAYVQTPNIFTHGFALFLNVHVSLCRSVWLCGGAIADNQNQVSWNTKKWSVIIQK